LKNGIAITQNDKVVGLLVPMPAPYQGQPRELEFIERTNVTLLYGAFIGAVIALLLGVFLSRTLTRPIRELTRATHAVSGGDLSQQVPVRSKDELGELAQALQQMSSQLSRSVNARRQMTADIAHEFAHAAQFDPRSRRGGARWRAAANTGKFRDHPRRGSAAWSISSMTCAPCHLRMQVN
jgi:HAMP domain-containing protein